MDIMLIYHDYLVHLEKEREISDEKMFHASSAGHCFRKQMYRYFDFPKEPMNETSYRILRLGTVVHKDVENAIIHYKKNHKGNSKIYTEDKIKLESLNVVGTYDYGELSSYNDSGEDRFSIYDLKTVAAYKWSKKFGRKPEATGDVKYKMQIGTYALGVENKYEPDKISMYLVWYNKNTSQIREQVISPEWIDKAAEYWTELNEILDDLGEEHFEEELKPEWTTGVPFENWECRYCQYSDICPSKLSK